MWEQFIADWISAKRKERKMKIVESYFQDLTPAKQQELIEFLGGENGNYDVFPIATLEVEDDGGDF